MTPNLRRLQTLQWERACAGTKMNPGYVPRFKYTDANANGLTRCVIDWLTLNGHQAERVSTEGRVIDTRKTVRVGLTQEITTGSVKRIPTSGKRGAADISSIVRATSGTIVSWKIEVKVRRDRQSEAQRSYEAEVKAAGGWYSIVRTFDDFIEQYNVIMTR